MLRCMIALIGTLILISALYNKHVDASTQSMSIHPRTSMIDSKKYIPKSDVLMISKLSSNVIPLKQIDDEDILSAPQAKGKAHPVKLV